jgi:hypothetical protein
MRVSAQQQLKLIDYRSEVPTSIRRRMGGRGSQGDRLIGQSNKRLQRNPAPKGDFVSRCDSLLRCGNRAAGKFVRACR